MTAPTSASAQPTGPRPPVVVHARHRTQRRSAGAAALAVALVLAVSGLLPAAAATTGLWAAWTPLVGSTTAFTTSVDLRAVGFPVAQVTTDSRSGQVGVISGASAWLSEGTPVGARYGSSRNQPYLNLRPRADNAASPSTTVYTFEHPTPASGWTFALGDIDADKVQVTGTTPSGRSLTAAELGFRGGFNYCAPGVVGKPSCTGAVDDVPAWDPATQTLTGNAAALDTNGAAGWFEPTVSVATLELTFTRRSGFPVYQTWFAALARDVSGTVTDVTPGGGGPLGEVTLTLRDADGRVVATTTTAPDGTYEFLGVVAADGFRVEATRPDGKIAVGPLRLPADLADADATDVDFQVRDIVPVPVSGTVTDDSGTPLGGVTVTIDDGAGGTQTVVTASHGSYLFDTVDPGTHTLAVTPPDGYTVTTAPGQVTVPPDSEEPVTDQDFVLTPPPVLVGSVSGTVTDDDGAGVGQVTVTVTGPDGPVTVTTAADGTYSLDGLPAGTYTITVTPPEGWTVTGEPTRTATVVAGAATTGQDFELAAAVAPTTPPPTTPPPTTPPPTTAPPTTVPPTSAEPTTGPPTPGTPTTAGPTTGGTGGSGTLPTTGADAGPLVALALVLVAAGCLTLSAHRRRTTGRD